MADRKGIDMTKTTECRREDRAVRAARAWSFAIFQAFQPLHAHVGSREGRIMSSTLTAAEVRDETVRDAP
jgi:hypothetical protein